MPPKCIAADDDDGPVGIVSIVDGAPRLVVGVEGVEGRVKVVREPSTGGVEPDGVPREVRGPPTNASSLGTS